MAQVAPSRTLRHHGERDEIPTFLHGDKAVADFLGVTTRTVANMVVRGDLTQYKIAGVKGNRYLLSDVVALVAPVAVAR